ncbi:cysteine dioxygenase [Paenibacillus sp. LMG 31456]|uniref:Cysteine dioxygenase n=1 Tax=Paenibacillus foliorum TaxID=2654974 RepID=A0A972GSV2_9BACL|nr:cysteine dioxygenase family protein [Paenibacillus foliorum]NOU96259.1 cysteine dioxygenase [Paenibacillus foliorum]
MKLLESIEQAFRSVTCPAPHELKAIITSLELTSEKVTPHIVEPSYLPYGRSVLFQSDDIEVILVHLPRGRKTLIHDHGASVGCAFILEGQMTNTSYRLDGYGYAQECGESTLKQHQFLYAPKGQIHQMSNSGEGRMLSFHVYAPRLMGIKSYRTYEEVLDYVI